MIHGARCTEPTLKLVCRPLVLLLRVCYISMKVDFVECLFIDRWNIHDSKDSLNISKSTLSNSAAAFVEVHLW